MKNYVDLEGCYPPQPSASADNTLLDLHNSSYHTLPHPINCLVLLPVMVPMVTYSFHALMNSINWPASSKWVFIAQLGEHCSANAEATGSNPVEAPKNFFSKYFRNCLNCDSLRWSHTHFINIIVLLRKAVLLY